MPLLDLVFDLDGTLVDSRPGIDRAAARAVGDVWPGREPVSLAPFIGPPIRTMFERAHPAAGEDELDALVRAFRTAYDGGDWRATDPYPGLGELLDAVQDAGGRAFVVTNKPHVATGRILAHLGLAERFVAALSPDGPDAAHATKADAIGALMRRYALRVSSAAYVGDSPDDRVAAQQAGLPFVAVRYGYGSAGSDPDPADLVVVDDLRELCPLLVRDQEP